MPGRATIADVARDAGVNKATASRALRGLPGVHAATRARVLASAQRLEYSASHVATALATGRSKVVGIVLPTIRSWFYSTVASGASSVLRPAGYRVELINLDGDRAYGHADGNTEGLPKLFEELGTSRDALLFAGPVVISETASGGLIGGRPSVTGLAIDHRAGTRQLTEYLIMLGHRRIAVLDGRVVGRPDTAMWQRRTDGVADALSAAGLTLDPALVIEPGHSGAAAGEKAMRVLLEQPELPTAVVCHADEMAFGAMAALRRAGLDCPQDISIAGFDNHPMARFWGLTTVSQHAYTQGVVAASALLRELEPGVDPPAPAEHVELGTGVDLIVRETTAAPPAQRPVASVASASPVRTPSAR